VITLIKGIAHLAFVVSDIDASLDFYVGALGFKKKFELGDDPEKPWIVYLQVNNDQFIELFPAYEAVRFQKDVDSYRHLCLEVEDIQSLVSDLARKGINIDKPVSLGLDNNYQAWIHDPDGNSIELMEYGKGSLQKK